ncbi:putative cysteine desulfurase [Stieleria maiorica]|uniref:Putative cysteine desulfurase n=1 Tax=Stieleria maiorica TaxID=2795974 RepID=A0A5B9MJ64_9BACT|nr:aminotransferase class V-fold PLP-dependent enzyme [Stieleria maiorica]QEG00490.1 putative cysteine desulfurase [Stieleria maiorica]
MLTESSRQRDFPSFSGKAYFNTAAEGIPPTAVLEALHRYGQDKLLGMDGRELHAVVWDSAKQQIARAYGLSADEVSLCSCSSEAYNLAALALGLREGDEVVINDLDFPAGATPWLHEQCPATVKIWRAHEWSLRIEDLIPLLGPRTRLVTTSLVSFFNGHKVNLPELVGTVRRRCPALISVDVTQALGRIPLDLSDVDLIVSSTHKWILASHGGGLVGVPSSSASRLTAPAGGWFHLQNAFDADRFQRATAKQGAASFSVGMPNYPAVYAIDAGLRYVRSVGVDAIDAHCRPLVRLCLDELKRLPVELITPDHPDHLAGIVAFMHPDANRIHAALHQQNIHVMCHAGRLRIAIHGYNDQASVERLIDTLRKTL